MSGLRTLPWAAWLDSGRPRELAGRYDIFVAEPQQTLISHAGECILRDRNGKEKLSGDNAIAMIREVMAERRCDFAELPFCGGMVGYFSYDLGRRWQGVPSRSPDTGLPEIALGVYDWAVVTDHLRERSWWVGRRNARDALELVKRLLRREPQIPAMPVLGAAAQTPDYADYAAAFERLLEYIRSGDCYQVNLARRIVLRHEGDPWPLYLALRERSAGPFSAYMALPFAQVLSMSPERFIRVDQGEVQTRPIKGTRPRRADPGADAREAEELRASPKDRAENVMIVDLLRNDLGKVCEYGSVRVDELCKLESFARVHHLVSTVRGRLRAGCDALDALAACLPGGSITGAPKHRAMQIIDELEPARRGIYCGAIAYLSDHGRMDSNIAIRTAVQFGGELSYWTGGGIVADSECAAEFEETLHKARQFLELAGRSGLR